MIRDVRVPHAGVMCAPCSALRPRSRPRETLDDAVRSYLQPAGATAVATSDFPQNSSPAPSPCPTMTSPWPPCIVQESCTNIVRHALAELGPGTPAAEGTPTIEVCDNGRGIVPPGEAVSGWPASRERVVSLAGSLDISSPPGGRYAHPRRLPSPGQPWPTRSHAGKAAVMGLSLAP